MQLIGHALDSHGEVSRSSVHALAPTGSIAVRVNAALQLVFACASTRGLSRPFPMTPLALLVPPAVRGISSRGCATNSARIYSDDAFAALLPTRGRSAESSWWLALVTLMRYVGRLADEHRIVGITR